MANRTGTLNDWAFHRKRAGLNGCSHKACKRAVDEGIVPMELIHGCCYEEADELWEAGTRKRIDEPSDSSAPAEYQASRARREAAEARISELKAAELDGSMVRLDDIIRAQSALDSALRSSLLSLPGRLAPDLVSAAHSGADAGAQVVAVSALLDRALRETLIGLRFCKEIVDVKKAEASKPPPSAVGVPGREDCGPATRTRHDGERVG